VTKLTLTPIQTRTSFWQSCKRNVFVGLLALVPLWITLSLVGVVLSFLRDKTAPLIEEAFSSFAQNNELIEYLVNAYWFQIAFTLFILLLFFYIVGFLTSRWLGRKAIILVDTIMERIPVAKSIYGAIKGVTDAMQNEDNRSSSVVLISFPSPELKTIALVTKTISDAKTGSKLAVVFVPTSPTPTSGYIEIVPVEELIYTDWSVEQAMSFLMSGGTDIPPSGLSLDQQAADPKISE